MTFSRFPEEKKPEPETTFPRPQTPPKPEPKKEEPPTVRFPQTKPDEPSTHKVERKPEPKVKAKKTEAKAEEKEEKAAPVRKTRTTVLRDIVEDLEGGEHISDEMRADLQELNRRLTRALAS